MPHIIVKLIPGKTGAQKRELARAITDGVTDIVGKVATLYKPPGDSM